MRHEVYMMRALELAACGRGRVEPNPMVGAVIVRDGDILAEGHHRKFGGLHAEREAFADAAAWGVDVAGATMYVTLEPCSHYGKTPPCTEAIIEAGLTKVYVAMVDPDEQVAGRGIEILREAGIEVKVGICEREAKQLLAAYIKQRTQQRPWVIAKWAQTQDGYLALPVDSGRWISGEVSRKRVHEVRSWCDGILVGIGTVEADDPMLNNRSGFGRQPERLVLDSNLKISPDCKLVQTAEESPVIVVTTQRAIEANSEVGRKLVSHGVEVLPLPEVNGVIDLNAVLDEFGRRQWTNLLVEGGAKVLNSFCTAGLVDELQIFIAPFELGSEFSLPNFDIKKALKQLPEGGYQSMPVETLGEDELHRFVRWGN